MMDSAPNWPTLAWIWRSWSSRLSTFGSMKNSDKMGRCEEAKAKL